MFGKAKVSGYAEVVLMEDEADVLDFIVRFIPDSGIQLSDLVGIGVAGPS